MGDQRFGPNSRQVEAFLARLRELTPSDWETVVEAAPGVGSVPDLEVSTSPDYFKALDVATRAAKAEVFPGSQTAFYEAMREAQRVADESAFQPSTRPELAGSAVIDDRLPPDAEADAIARIMSTAYEEESYRRVMNACMVAAGALVVSTWIGTASLSMLCRPFEKVLPVRSS